VCDKEREIKKAVFEACKRVRDGKLVLVCAALHVDDCKQVVVVIAGLHLNEEKRQE